MVDNTPDWARDPTPVASSGVPEWASDPAPATSGQLSSLPEDNSGHILGPGGRLDRLGHLMHGEFQGAVMNGFGGLVARKGYELAGVPKDQVNAAVIKARQDAAKEVQDSGSKGFNPLGFAAGVAGSADPTFLINPGAGVAERLAGKGAARVATRIAANTAAHAAFGSATDAAYQGADILDGLQKDFDIKRNLEASAMQGAFGGGHAVVSEFVSNLFKARGVDTKPSDNPTQRTTPLTGQGLTPEEKTQYAEVLKTGDEHEIRDFFKGRNTQPPSFTDAHEWVSRRDAVNEGHAPPDWADESFHPEPGPPDARPAVQAHIEEHTASWKNAPEFEVINHVDDIQDPAVKEAALKEGADDPSALGFLGPDGKVRIFASRIDSPDVLNSVIYHEALGHYGLAQQFGDRLDNTITTLLKRNVGQFGMDVNAWQKKNPGAYGGDRIRAAEEVLANMSNNGTLKKSVGDALVAQVRGFGRKMGLKMSYSDAEVRTILSMAHNAVINGKGRDVRANGFRYMFTGENAATFDPHAKASADRMLKDGSDPNTVRQLTGVHYANDKLPRMEISDDGAKIKEGALQNEGETTLGEVLHHPRLFEAYPALKDVYVKHEPLDGLMGQYDPATRTIGIHSDLSEKDKFSTLLHETQHAIQDMEYYPGHQDSTLHMTDEEYHNNPLEKEAYLTEARQGLSGMDRRGGDIPKFMRKSDLEPKDIAEEAYDRLVRSYVPREPVSWEQDKARADATALDPAMVRESRSVGNLTRKLFVYDEAATRAQERLMSFKTDEPLSGEDHIAALEALVDFNYTLGRLDNDLAHIGRALNAAKALRYSRGNIAALYKKLQEDGTNMEAAADPDTMIKFLKQYQALINNGNPNGAAQMMKSVTSPYWWQYLLTWRQSMMLSGPSTYLKNGMDMATTAGRDIEDKIVALPAGLIREGMQAMGLNVKSGLRPSELGMHIWGLSRAVLDAQTWKDATHTLVKGGEQRFGANTQIPRIPVVSKITDGIAAQDTFFRAILTNGNLYELGTRRAFEEAKAAGKKISGDDARVAGAAFALNPDPHMMAAAKDLTENTMLINRSPMNSVIDKSKNIRPGMHGMEQLGSFIVNYLTPFIRVQSNALFNQIIRRSPLSIMDPVTRADWKAGGARRDVAIARTIVGTAILMNAWNAAAPGNDKITGEGPENYAKIKELEASSWQRNSIHENGRYNRNSNLNISLNPFDLHNNTASLVANVREAYDAGAKGKDLATGLRLAYAAVMHDLLNQTFVNDLGEAYDAFADKGQTFLDKSGNFVAKEVASFLPNATTQAAKILDPNKHDARDDILGPSMAAIPGLTHNVPLKYNVYGQPEKTGTSVTGVHTWLTDGNGVQEATDPTEKELGRLAGLTKAAIVTPTLRTVDVKRVPVKLTIPQAEEYQKYAGQTIVQAVRDQMESGDWAKLSDQDRINEVRSIQTRAKKQVRETLLQTEGWLNEKQLSSLRSQLGTQ